jgi:hypothetical protein
VVVALVEVAVAVAVVAKEGAGADRETIVDCLARIQIDRRHPGIHPFVLPCHPHGRRGNDREYTKTP